MGTRWGYNRVIPGVTSSNQRIKPFSSTSDIRQFTVSGASSVSTVSCLPAYLNGKYYFRDGQDADVMSSDTITGTYTDVATTVGDTSAKIMGYENGLYWMVNGGATTSFSYGTVIDNTMTTRTNAGTKLVRSVVWYAAANLYVAVGSDEATTANNFILTSPDGVTWTSRGNIGTSEAPGRMATNGTTLVVATNNGTGKYTTSTSAPFSWTGSSPFAGSNQYAAYLKYVDSKGYFVGMDKNQMTVYSANGQSWLTKSVGFTGFNTFQCGIDYIPAYDRWIAWAIGDQSKVGKGTITSISDTGDLASATFSLMINDDKTYIPANWDIDNTQGASATVTSDGNRYLMIGAQGTSTKYGNTFYYIRAG